MFGKNGRTRPARLRTGAAPQIRATSLSTRIITRRYDPGHDLLVRSLSGAVLSPEPGRPAEYEVPASGWPLHDTETALSASAEYEVPPEGWGPAASPVDTPAADAAPAPYEQAPVPPPRPPVSQAPSPPPPAAPEQKLPPAQPDGSGGSALAEDVLMSDIQSILSAAKPARPASPAPGRQAAAQSRPAPPAAPSRPAPPAPNRQEIFDRIAQSMAHAKTYDLGSIALQERFDAFDQDLDRQEARTRAMTAAARHAAPAVPAAPTAEFVEDLDWMRRQQVARAADIPLDPGIGGRSIGLDALEPGDIILSTTTALVSRAIRSSTGAPVSHSAVYVGNNQLVEAIGDGVVLRSLDTALEDDSLAVAYRHRDMTPQKAALVVDFLTEQARQRRSYDHWGLVRVAPGQLARAVCSQMPEALRQRCLDRAAGLRVGTDDQDRFYCSELVLEALERAGLSLSDVEHSWSSPGQILDLHYNGLLDYVGHLKV